MTYKDYFVAEVKVGGKILRVQNDKVFLPFNSEYSILLKNLNTKRAKVKIQIDGQDVLSGHSIVMEANQTLDLAGFMKGSKVTNRFKFIEKTQEISDYRGDRVDDGLIRIEFAYEKPITYYYYEPLKTHWTPTYTPWDVYGTSNDSSRNVHVGDVTCNYCNISSNEFKDINDKGITVKGSETRQDFLYTTFGDSEEPQVIILQLVGKKDTGNVVQEPLTIEKKLVCKTCGRSWKSFQKFCGNCGTFLE